MSAPQRPRIPVTWIAAALMVAMWLSAVVAGVDPWAPAPADLVATGGNLAVHTASGQWWRLITSALVHAGALHLVINVAALVGLGTVLERRTGRGGAAVVLIGAAVTASAASLAWAPYAVSVGASGAVSGVCGALLVALIRAGETFTPRAAAITAAALAGFVAWGLVLAARVDGVDHAAHGVGLITGAALGLLVIGDAPHWRGLAGLLAAAAIAAVVVATAAPTRDLRADARHLFEINARFDAIVSGAGLRPDGPQLARTLEGEVLAPLRDLAATDLVDPRMPPRDRARAAALRAYAVARLRALELFVRYLDSGDASLEAEIDAASAAAAAALDRLDTSSR